MISITFNRPTNTCQASKQRCSAFFAAIAPAQERIEGPLESSSTPQWSDALRVIPLVKVTDKRHLWQVWPTVNSPVLAINFLDVLARKGLYDCALENGIKETLGYNGKCVAIIVGPNWRLYRIKIKKCVSEIEAMGFDASTTLDDYVYQDDPPDYSWNRVQHCLDKANEMMRLDPSFDIVGTVKGSSDSQVRFCIDRLVEMGLNHMMFPCSELVGERNHSEILSFMRYTKLNRIWSWLIGVGSPRLIRRFAADCSSTSKWVWAATKGWAFTPYGQKHTGHPDNCPYDACQELYQNHFSEKAILTRHNFQTLLDIGMDLRGGVHLGRWQ